MNEKIKQELIISQNEMSQESALDMMDRAGKFMVALMNLCDEQELPPVVIIGALEHQKQLLTIRDYELAKECSQ